MSQTRLAGLRDLLKEQELDWLLVESPHNRRYLSGFTGSTGFLLISQQEAILATDFRYYEQATEQAPAFSLAKLEGGQLESLASFLLHILAEEARLGFEADHLTVALHEKLLSETGKVVWVPTEGQTAKLRVEKDAQEIDSIRRAVALADEALEAISRALRPGMTEQEVAWQLEVHMRERGASKLAFDIIVASGPNGARPHAQATDRPLQAGEPIVIDMGCVVDGYCSDLTRTFVLGQADGRFEELYALVLEAQKTAELAIAVGMSGREADALARDVINAAGHGELFGHSLGHGVGLDVHELPHLSSRSDTVLREGMVFTVEPGMYIPGWGGIRIEDMGVLQADGLEVLTACSKEPVIVLQ